MNLENKELKQKIGKELSEFNASYNIKTDLLGENFYEEVSGMITMAKQIMIAKPYNDLKVTEQDDVYKELSKAYNELKDKVNNANCKLELLGSQCKEVSKAVKNATYTAETLFWGVKIDDAIISKIDKSKLTNDDVQLFDLSFSNLVMLHYILTTTPFVGLSFESYLIAKTILDITEYVKLYNNLQAQLDKLSRSIDAWEEGLDIKL